MALRIMYNGAVIVNIDCKQQGALLPRRRSHLHLSFKVLLNISAMMKDTADLIGRPEGLCWTALHSACIVAAGV